MATEKDRERQRRAYAADPAKGRAKCKRYYDNNLQAQRVRVRANARRFANLPQPTREDPGFCECCGRLTEEVLCLDHSHITGDFRGWLCKACNRGIGSLGDDTAGVEKALAYLRRVS